MLQVLYKNNNKKLFSIILKRHDPDHHEEFSHPGDPDYHSSDNHLQKRKCRYGEDCFRLIFLFLFLFNKSILFFQ
jgi:hypothetical protein